MYLKGILIKTCSEPMQRIYIRGSLLGRSLINSMHSLSTILLTALPCFPLLYYRLFEFLYDTLAHIQPDFLNIGTFEMFKAKF